MTISLTLFLLIVIIVFIKYQGLKVFHAILVFVLGLFIANDTVGIKMKELVMMFLKLVGSWKF